MIEEAQGSLLDAEAEALVNTVNCVGAMGKGIALQFKQKYPENFKAYDKAVRAGLLRIGRMFTFHTGTLVNPRYIINFPTKEHWRGSSRLEYIQDGMLDLVSEIKRLGITSVAIPPLGCGNGGLDWADVRPIIEDTFAKVPSVQVLMFTPRPAPEAERMAVAYKPPQMTRARALIIRLMEMYRAQGYRLTLLEIQKLAYFLQTSGLPMKLKYERNRFGPYAENLNHLLQKMEAAYIRGYGDRSRQSPGIYLLPEAIEASEKELNDDNEAEKHLERVARLIEGFETPYGMELLASVHWVAEDDPLISTNPDAAIAAVHKWNPRKHKLFTPDHIRTAWKRLRDEGWLPESSK